MGWPSMIWRIYWWTFVYTTNWESLNAEYREDLTTIVEA
jgi:hypothetical protein